MSNRLSEIIQRLERIALETKDLTKELRELQQRDGRSARRTQEPPTPGLARTTIRTSTQDKLHEFEEGQAVIITNAYGNQQGTRGTIRNTTRTTISLVDETGRLHTRKYTNIRLI
jgi:hypothetical protein